jgi:hypothetical protein
MVKDLTLLERFNEQLIMNNVGIVYLLAIVKLR